MGGGAGEVRGGEVYLLHAPAFGVEKTMSTSLQRADGLGWRRWAGAFGVVGGPTRHASPWALVFLIISFSSFFCKRKVRRKMEFGKVLLVQKL